MHLLLQPEFVALYTVNGLGDCHGHDVTMQPCLPPCSAHTRFCPCPVHPSSMTGRTRKRLVADACHFVDEHGVGLWHRGRRISGGREGKHVSLQRILLVKIQVQVTVVI